MTTPTGVSIVDIVDRLGMTFLSGGDTVDDARTVSRVTLHEGSGVTQGSAGAVVLGAAVVVWIYMWWIQSRLPTPLGGPPGLSAGRRASSASPAQRAPAICPQTRPRGPRSMIT